MNKITYKAARINAGLTAVEAAEALGIASSTLSNYERGLYDPQREILLRMAKLYGWPMEALVPSHEDDERDNQ